LLNNDLARFPSKKDAFKT